MFTDTSRLTFDWLALVPLAQGSLTIDVNGFTVLVIIAVLGAYVGFMRGVRALLTITMGTIVAYILTVQGGEIVANVINRLWQNGPRLVNFLLSNDPGNAAQLDPLIPGDFQVSLFFRFVFFVMIVAISWFFNRRSKWYAGGPAKTEPLAPVLGAFGGALVALLWSNALARFYAEYTSTGAALGYPIGTILAILPDVSAYILPLIIIFFILLVIVLFFYLPRVVTVPEAPKK